MQRTRWTFQACFLALTLWAVFIAESNAERWCPFGGVEALKTYVSEGNMTCSLGISNFYALGGLLLTVLLVRRAFCSYMCPIASISEWITRLAARLGLRQVKIPAALDRVFSSLKYGVLVLILYVTWNADELLFRVADPCYALISRHGEDITFWSYVVSGAIILAALVLTVPFCRWLCPLAAVMNPLSRIGLSRVQRVDSACSGCNMCDAVCPMQIPVATSVEVKAARCTSCLECVTACPRTSKGALTWGPPAFLGMRWPRAALAGILLVAVTSVVTAAYAFPLASFVRARGEAPQVTAAVELLIKGVKCRGSANQLIFFLERDDIFEIGGFLKTEAWPDPGFARIRITYDPSQTDADAIKEAIATPYFDTWQGFERESPFEIEGYAPWDDKDGG